MKHILHKACLTMLLFVVGVCCGWAVEISATMAAGTNGSTAKVNNKDAIKVGTSSAGGTMTIKVPANSVSLTFYAVAWKGVTESSLNITPTSNVKTQSVSLTADAGIANNSPFTLQGGEDDYKFTIALNNVTEETTFTFTGSKRFVVWGATCDVQNNTTYTVTFNAGSNGTCATSSLTESSVGSGVTLPTVVANSGYDFKGWSSDQNPSSANAGVSGDTYNPTENITLYAYYTIVRPANEVFYESFDTNDGTGGNDGQWSGSIASNKLQSDNSWTTASASGASQCAKFGTGSALGSAQTPAIAASGSFVLTFKAAAWNGNSESTTLKLSATDATLSASSVTLTKGAWETYTINITNATEGFTIKFAGNNTSNSRFFLDEVSIVSAATLSVSSVGYATYYNEAAYVMPEGLVGKIMQENQDGSISSMEAYTADGYKIVPANTALLIKGEPGNYVLAPTSEKGDADYDALIADANLLHGSLTDETTTGGSVFYKFANGSKGLGWYYGEDNGAAFTNPAHKAYLALDAAVAESVRFIAIDFETPTAIESVEANVNTEVYDLAGRRVKNAANGLYIVNGKKVIR